MGGILDCTLAQTSKLAKFLVYSVSLSFKMYATFQIVWRQILDGKYSMTWARL